MSSFMHFPICATYCTLSSCATIMLYLGYSLKDIQTWLGHSNYNFTADTYIHSGMGAHEQIVLSMSEWLGELLPQNIAPDLTAI